MWSFQVLQSTAKKCTKNYNAPSKPLYCAWIILLLSDVPISFAIVVFVNAINYVFVDAINWANKCATKLKAKLFSYCGKSSFKSESTWGPCRQVYSAHHRFPRNLAHLYNITSTLTMWNRLVQLSIVYEICQSSYKTLKSARIWSKNIPQVWSLGAS